MHLSFLRRLVKEDFAQQYQDVVGKIGYVINPAMEQLSLALKNNLTWSDNIAAQVITFQVTVDSSGTPSGSISFASTLNSPINHMMVTRANAVGNTTIYPTSAPFISFIQNGTNVSINNITGLPANIPFNITLIASI